MVIHARGSRMRGPAILSFVAALVANLIWSPLFFGMHQVLWSLVLIGIMFALGLITTLLFSRVRTGAALLLLPYLAWLIYAGVLEYQLMQLNPGAETLVPSSATTQINV